VSDNVNDSAHIIVTRVLGTLRSFKFPSTAANVDVERKLHSTPLEWQQFSLIAISWLTLEQTSSGSRT
jgi:hypothetical protein